MNNEQFRDTVIEAYKKNSVLEYFRAKRRAEFLRKLKEGRQYARTDDPGPM